MIFLRTGRCPRLCRSCFIWTRHDAEPLLEAWHTVHGSPLAPSPWKFSEPALLQAAWDGATVLHAAAQGRSAPCLQVGVVIRHVQGEVGKR